MLPGSVYVFTAYPPNNTKSKRIGMLIAIPTCISGLIVEIRKPSETPHCENMYKARYIPKKVYREG